MAIEFKSNQGILTLGALNTGGSVEEVYVGASAPTKETIKVWVNPEGDLPDDVATKAYVDDKIDNLDISGIDLTGYATEQYVNDAISAIELTPGPQGEKGEPGAPGAKGEDGKTPVKGTDYFTEQDKQEIVNDVLFALPAAEEVGV